MSSSVYEGSQASENGTEKHEAPNLPIVYTVLEASVAVCAVFGNLLVIVVFLQDRRLRKVTNFYIISLSVADFLVGLIGSTSIPFSRQIISLSLYLRHPLSHSHKNRLSTQLTETLPDYAQFASCPLHYLHIKLGRRVARSVLGNTAPTRLP